MELVEAQIRSEHWDVDLRLSQLGLSREKLLAAVAVAMHERANATPFHPINAAGTFAYQHGVWALRNEFVGREWVEDRADGVEGIRNEALGIKVAFSNVDRACQDDHIPRPRSSKGAGAERASCGNLFGDLPRYAKKLADGIALYYLMVDEDGAAELTRAVVASGRFTNPIERIYITRGGDGEADILLSDNDDVANDFEPQVARR